MKKSLLGLNVPSLSNSKLTQHQVLQYQPFLLRIYAFCIKAERILHALDANGDGMISAREFKHWYAVFCNQFVVLGNLFGLKAVSRKR